MSFFQSFFLAVVQGVTEFLPISSSGHLVLFQKLLSINDPPVLFFVLLHLGTLGAIIVFFRNEIYDLVINWQKRKKVWVLLVIGSIPATVFGLFLNSKIEELFGSLKLVAISWIIFGLFLLSLKFIKNKGSKEKLEKINYLDAFIIGIFQSAALFPGISRSGSTVVGGILNKLSPANAFVFSFLLSIPVTIGAVILKIQEVKRADINIFICLLAMLIAGLVGFFCLRILKKILVFQKFYYFGFYCFFIGVLVLLFL